MRDESREKWGRDIVLAGAITVGSPPLAGTHTMSSAPPRPSRSERAGPRITTMRFPLGDQAGVCHPADAGVRRCGSPPSAATFHRWPPACPLLQLTYAIDRPSGLHAGWYSPSPDFSR